MNRFTRRSNRSRRGVTRPGAGFCAAALAGVAAHAGAQGQPGWSSVTGTLPVGIYDLTVARSWPSGVPVLTGIGGFQFPPPIGLIRIAEWDGWRLIAPASGRTFGLQAAYATAFVPPSVAPAGLPGLYVGGSFDPVGGPARNIARWAGGGWSEPGGGVGSYVMSTGFQQLAPGGSAIYIGGPVTAGGTVVNGVARWDGNAWGALGGGLSTPVGQPGYARAFEVYDDDGPGPRPPALFVLGSFEFAGGTTVWEVARWDGVAWSALADGLPGGTECARVFDHDGAGPAREMLYVGGPFNVAGGYPVYGLARWDGAAWHDVPGWAGASNVFAMEAFDDDGAGPNKPSLFIAGIFPVLGSIQANNIVRWDGDQWFPVGGGVSGGTGFPFVNSLCLFDEDGPGPNPGGLYVGGNFSEAGGIPSRGIARWGCPLPPRCDANCNRDFHPITGAHILTVADFGCFQTRYVLQDPYADCNEDGQLTVADFGCFQTRFVAGCP